MVLISKYDVILIFTVALFLTFMHAEKVGPIEKPLAFKNDGCHIVAKILTTVIYY